MIKLFEEYRYIRIKHFADGYGNEKDPNEPFFNKPKKAYLEELQNRKREEERRRWEEQQRINNEYRDEQERRLIEIGREQMPLVSKYLDIVKNHTEEIVKSKYDPDRGKNLIMFGILLKDRTQIITQTRNGRFYSLKINGQDIQIYKERPKLNLDEDPFGEESWNTGKSKVEILSDLVINYVKENEIIF